MSPGNSEANSATIVVIGGAGDLMRRKLFPALYRLAASEQLPRHTQILGVARRPMEDVTYRRWAAEALADAGVPVDERTTRWCEACLFYHSLGAGSTEDYRALAVRIDGLERQHGRFLNRVFYLAIPPETVPVAITTLGEVGLHQSAGWTRLVVEKPFGHDSHSDRHLNRLLHRYFDESQVYRIDHYLGKETVQNLMAFRFANPVFETQWNRDRVESVQITVAEDIGIEDRAGYYEKAGALRDIMQNHLTQLLTLVAMELPISLAADDVRGEKLKVLQAISPVTSDDIVLGQYTAGTIRHQPVPGYRQEPHVAPDSRTVTYAAVRVTVEGRRWRGVPFYLRTGKRLARRLTQIVLRFHPAPASPFSASRDRGITPNILSIIIQPDEGFELDFQVKTPGQPTGLTRQHLAFRYAQAFGPLPDAYETLLLDVLVGDQTLFVRADEAEKAWEVYAAALDDRLPIAFYPAGSWGPAEADRLFVNPGGIWVAS